MPVDAEKFRVVNDITGETVYEGNLEGEIYDKSAGENDCFGYFSELKTPGHIELKQMVQVAHINLILAKIFMTKHLKIYLNSFIFKDVVKS